MDHPNRTLLLVDVSNHAWRAAAAHPMLTCRRAFTGGLYGFFVTVAKIIREVDATRVVFGLDSRPYVRSAEYPEYKQARKKHMDEGLKEMAHESIAYIVEALRSSGLPVWEAPGFEFDDLAGLVVTKYRHRWSRLWAASNDSDLWQLFPLCDRFAVYRGNGLADAMRASKFAVEAPGFSQDDWVTALAMQGTHNDVAGIPGIGPAKALGAIRDPAKLRSLRAAHGALIDRNARLIRLPHRDLPKDTRLPGLGGYDARALYRYLSRFEIDVTPSIERAFLQVGGAR